MGPDIPEQPEAGPHGYAVKLDGVLSLRSASTRPEGAKINGLVLFFGLPAYQTASMTDSGINFAWEQAVELCSVEHILEIVAVVCTEVADAAPN